MEQLGKWQHVSGVCSPVQEWGCQHSAGGAGSAGSASALPSSGNCSCLECRLGWRIHAQFVGERKVVMCLTVSLRRKPVKSYTNISVIKEQLSSKESQEPWAISDILIDIILKIDGIVNSQQLAFRVFLPFCRYNNELHMQMLEQ